MTIYCSKEITLIYKRHQNSRRKGVGGLDFSKGEKGRIKFPCYINPPVTDKTVRQTQIELRHTELGVTK